MATIKKDKVFVATTKKEKAPITVKNCTFYGQSWDKESLRSLNDVAKALLNITEIYKGTNIQVTALHIGDKNADGSSIER